MPRTGEGETMEKLPNTGGITELKTQMAVPS